MQLLDFGPHRDAQLGVEIGQRLVEQEHLRIAHDGAAHGDALALAARKLARIAVEIGREAQDIGGLRAPSAPISAAGAFLSLSEKPILSATVICG